LRPASASCGPSISGLRRSGAIAPSRRETRPRDSICNNLGCRSGRRRSFEWPVVMARLLPGKDQQRLARVWPGWTVSEQRASAGAGLNQERPASTATTGSDTLLARPWPCYNGIQSVPQIPARDADALRG
jgi:hypothetical protein